MQSRAVALLAAVVLTVVAVFTLGSPAAVADSGTLARTRVAASNLVQPDGVGPIVDIGPGEGRKTSPGSYDNALGCCVATKSFDVVLYRPANEGLENHHGVLDIWARWNVPGYRSRASDNPTIALTPEQHDATKRVYRDWLEERTGQRVGGKVDWTSVGPREIADL